MCQTRLNQRGRERKDQPAATQDQLLWDSTSIFSMEETKSFLGCAVTQAYWTCCLFCSSSKLLTLHTRKYKEICPWFPNHSNSMESLIVLSGLERLGSAGKKSSSGDFQIAMISAQTNLSGFGSQLHSLHAGEILSLHKK